MRWGTLCAEPLKSPGRKEQHGDVGGCWGAGWGITSGLNIIVYLFVA